MAVSLNVLDEQRIDLAEAAKLLGSESRPASVAKMSRAVNRGVLTEGGERVRLEAVRTGGCWLTSIEAVRRFVTRLTRDALGDGGVADEPDGEPSTPVSARRRRQLASVDRELDKAFGHRA